MALHQGKYSSRELSKNRLNVLTTAVLGLAVLVVIALVRSWEVTEAMVTFGTWVFFCSWAYWVFASKDAGPIDVTIEIKQSQGYGPS